MRRLGLLMVCICATPACLLPPEAPDTGYFECYEGPVHTLRFVETQDGLFVFTMHYRGIQWHPVNEDGTLGALAGKTIWLGGIEEDPFGFGSMNLAIEEKWAVMKHHFGFRIVTETHSLYVTPGNLEARKAPLTPASPQIPVNFAISLVMPTSKAVYVVWSARDPASKIKTRIAGLGVLSSADRVMPLGEPFYRETGELYDSLLPHGGWDEKERRFWIVHPDRRRIYELNTNGEVVQLLDHEQSPKFNIWRWRKLTSGKWVGTHGAWLCFFDPQTWPQADCQLLEVNSQGKVFSHDILVTRDGSLWIGYRNADGVILGRWDFQASRLKQKVFTPLSVENCSLMMSTF